jgi:HD-GYP domain-containing protein (c-di-GMP phosphodiesterase class II)
MGDEKIILLDFVGLPNDLLHSVLGQTKSFFEYIAPDAIPSYVSTLETNHPKANIVAIANVGELSTLTLPPLLIARTVVISYGKRKAHSGRSKLIGASNLHGLMVIDILQTPIEADDLLYGLRRAEVHFKQRREFRALNREIKDQQDELTILNEIGIALSSEQNMSKLLEMILGISMEMTNADAGTIYIIEDKPGTPPDKDNYLLNKQLAFRHSRNYTKGSSSLLDIKMEITPKSIVGYAAISGEALNLPDVYFLDDSLPYKFGGRDFDKKTSYRTMSMLTIPMQNHDRETIGVIQLINKKTSAHFILDSDTATHEHVVGFDEKDVKLIRSFASQSAIAYENRDLVESIKKLLEAFIQMMADAIDKKSPYTGGHCNRVPVLTEMLAKAACESTDEPFKAFNLTKVQWYELHIAAWLHDCGKVVTPVHVMDKSTKLETIYDRIHTIKTRFEVLRRDAELDHLRALSRNGRSTDSIHDDLQSRLAQLDDDQRFIETVNIGGEFLSDEKIERIKRIAAQHIRLNGEVVPFLSEEEVYNLSIRRGTLTTEERKVINDHIVVTIDMLEKLPFPRSLMRVPEYAGGHHEKMDGTGYPKGLRRDEMSIPARIMAIADVFEALTAVDRPYKKGKTLSESMNIMKKMKEDHHLDPDLLNLFVSSGVYKDYATKYMQPELIDEVNEAEILAAQPKEKSPRAVMA